MKNPKKSLLKPNFLKITSVICLFSIMIPAIPALAQVTFNPPGAKAPKNSSGGASRDLSTCGADMTSATKASVTPLLPKTNIGLTIAERPVILVYIPQTNAKEAFFSLKDEQGKQYYEATLLLPQKRGVMEVKLPNSVLALKTNKNYQWSLAMICSQELEPDSPSVSGWIRRVESSNRIANKPTLELASNLANKGIWYDSLATVAELKRTQPNNPKVASSWEELLKAADLKAIAEAPLAN